MELLNLKYEFNPQVIYKDSGDLIMAYNQENSDMYEFNSVGGNILKKLADNKPINKMFEEIMIEYEVSMDDIYSDIEEIINRMIELGIIVVRN